LPSPTPISWWRYGLLIAGVAACATAVIFIKASETHPILLCAWRLLIGATLLTPLFLRARQRHADAYGLLQLRRCLLPALLLATHFISWTVGARRTDAANASLIVNLVPIVMPFLMFAMAAEHITRREIVGTTLSLIGLGILGMASFKLRPEHVVGDTVCLGSMLLFALYLACGRVNRDFPSIWLYVTPVYAIAGILCLGAGIATGAGFLPVSGREWALMAALGLIPTVFGHSVLNHAMKHLRGQVVSLCNLSQFIFAGILAYFAFREIPSSAFAAAAVLIVIGAVIVIHDRAATGVASNATVVLEPTPDPTGS
jgi:drug/metabolite transporter (DMT)-like permease